jgi:hypothetical protein
VVRRAVCLAVLAVLVVPVPPAAAKLFSVDHAELRGPGLDRPLRLSDEQFVGHNRRGSPSLSATLGDAKLESPPPGALGPRFELELHLDVAMPEQPKVVFRSDLYPYAAAGPVSFTPAGQTWIIPGSGREEITPGWSQFPVRFVRKWQRLGLPSNAAAERASPYPWDELAVAWSAAATLVLLGCWFVMRAGPEVARRSRPPRPAHPRGTPGPG